MSTLRVHLWKEWREHRVVLGALVLLVAAVSLVAVRFAGASFFRNPAVAPFFGLCAALGVMLTLGSELLAGEEGARLRFLERLPGGLAAAFRAKLLLYAAALVSVQAWAVLAMIAASLWRAGRLPEDWSRLFDTEFLVVMLLQTFALAFWPFSASAWAPRGSLSTPLAAIVLGVLAWPCWLLVARWGYRPRLEEFFLAVVLLGIGALASARHGFVHGRARGGTKPRAAGRSLLVAAACLCPIWILGAWRVRERFVIDPSRDDFVISHAFVGEGVVFVDASNSSGRWTRPPDHALVVDSETGAWKDVGGPDSYLLEVPRHDEASLVHWPNVPSGSRMVDLESSSTLAWFDERGEKCLDPIDEGALELWMRPTGLGFRTGRGLEGEIWDPYRRGRFRLKTVLAAEDEGAELLVIPSGWLIRSPEGTWRHLDPVTGSERALEWPRDDSPWHPVLADGRIFLAPGGSLVLGDADTGSLVELRLPDGVTARAIGNPHGWCRPFRSDQPILLGFGEGLFRVDLDELSVARVPGAPFMIVCGSRDDDSVVVRDGGKLLALDLRTGERRVLFPRR